MKLTLFLIGTAAVIYLAQFVPPAPSIAEVKLTLQNGDIVSEKYCRRPYKSDCYECTSATYCSPTKIVEVWNK